MKRYLFLLLIIMFAGGLLFSDIIAISVTNPASGENVTKGSAYTIQWTKSGSQAATVKIRLYNSTNTTKILNIVDSTANNGSYDVPANLFNGVTAGDYVIRIKTTDNAVGGVSGVFHLVDTPSPSGSINVTKPGSHSKWYQGKEYNITWNHSAGLAGTVKIRLYNASGTTKLLDITNSTANDGSFPWTPPASLSGDYKIKVKTTDNAVEAFSDVFTIKKKILLLASKDHLKLFKKEIEVLSPTAGKYWDEGKEYLIKWNNTYTKHKSLSIDLYFGNTLQKHIKTIPVNPNKMYFTNTSGTKWTIPYDTFKLAVNTGWKIKITRTDNTNIKGYSGKFYIRNAMEKKTVKIYGTTYNKVKWSKKSKKEFFYCGKPSAGDPGSGKMRVGYENLDNDTCSSSYIYRSYVMFDTSKLKGMVLSAKLRYKVFMGSPGCIRKVSNVDGDWSSNFFGVPLSYIPNPDKGLKPFVQKWISYPETNHGLLVSGPEEHFKQWGNDSCLAFAENVYLELEILGNK